MSKKVSSYDENSIVVLEGLEGVRKRPEMYIGSAANGPFHIFKEAVDNAIDEYLAGYNKEIYIKIDTKNNKYTVADKGRGIPVNTHPKTGISTLTTVMTMLHAGGKFDNVSYKISGGLHGLGISVTNALSSYLKVYACREGIWYSQQFKEGKPVTEVAKDEPKLKKWNSGTIVQMIPDNNIFKEKQAMSVDGIRKWFEILKYLCPKLKIKFKVDDNETEVFESDKGISNFIDFKAEELKVEKYHEPYYFQSDKLEELGYKFEVSLLWTSLDNELSYSYVNSIRTSEGGKHLVGLKRAISKVLGGLSNKDILADDLRLGLISIIHYKSKNVSYGGQTKDKFTITEAEKFVYEDLRLNLENYFKNNQNLANGIIQKAIKINQARQDFQKKRDALKNIKIYDKNKIGVLPGKLIEAPFCKPSERELIICLDGNTKIMLVDKHDLKIKDIVKRYEKGEVFNGFAFNIDKKRTEIVELENPRLTRENADVVEVTLEIQNSYVKWVTKFKCTADHTLLNINNDYVEAENSIGISLNPYAYFNIQGIRYTNIDTFIKVINIKKVRNKRNVYCLSTKYKNFAISAGCFVHNCEGDSAKGTLLNARDSKYQEIFPLRGKILNTWKSKSEAVSKNKELSDLLVAIGGIRKEKQNYYFDISHVRIGKLILMADADFDGFHITALLLTFIFKYMKELITHKKVFTVDAPLFIGSYKNKKYYGMTLKEVQDKAGKDSKNLHITRLKGWAECPADDMYQIVTDKQSRKLIRITENGECNLTVDKVMGADSSYRKEILGL